MKKTQTFIIALLLITISAGAQKIKIVEGSLAALKGQPKLNIEFSYNDMKVGAFDREEDYVSDKKAKLNTKEPGRGDSWERMWKSDRSTRFEPKFDELFYKYSKMQVQSATDAKYTMIFNTNFTEPGFNVYVARRPASINADITIVETADHSKVISKLSLEKAKGRSFGGNDYDTGERITEAYALAGKGLAKFIVSKAK